MTSEVANLLAMTNEVTSFFAMAEGALVIAKRVRHCERSEAIPESKECVHSVLNFTIFFPWMKKKPYIYILFNKRNGTLYTGVTSNLVKRVYEHKNKVYEGFTSKYGVDKLGYYEVFNDIKDAIIREKQIKSGSRKKKIQLIESINPTWLDLYERIKP